MLGTPWTAMVALVAAFSIALAASPVGISGAVLLLPFQVSVLGTPSPSVTPTNLLYNVVATPGAIYRYWRQGQTGGRLTAVLVGGTLPGVIAGSVIRVELLPGPKVFDLIVGSVLTPLGLWLAASRPPRTDGRVCSGRPVSSGKQAGSGGSGARPGLLPAPALIVVAAAVGCVGGIYGIGGGSVLAPILTAAGRRPAEVAPATLAATFVTSVAGVVTFTILSLHLHAHVAPDWTTGIALGVGGLAGGYAGARIQASLPEVAIRRVMGLIVFAIGVRYLWSGLA